MATEQNRNEIHNKVVTDFVMSLTKVNTVPELCVVTESALVGIMLLWQKAFNMPPQVAVDLMSLTLDQAITRYAEESIK